MNKILYRKIGITLITISILSIVVRMPVGKPGRGFFDIQFWTYIIMSILNIWVGILILHNHKNSAKIATAVIIATYIATQVASSLVMQLSAIDYIVGAIIPALLLYGIRASFNSRSKDERK